MTSEVTQTALEPCPWCGTVEHLSFQWPGSMTADMPDRPCRVVCTHIDHDTVVGPTAYGKFAAIAAWNTRLTAQSGVGRALPWLSKLLRYHETGGHEGDGSDHAKRNARTELDAIVSGEGRSGAGEPWPGCYADLHERRVTTLAKLGIMLSLMVRGESWLEAVEAVGYETSELYAEVLMALAIEDADDTDIALEEARDHPEHDCLAALNARQSGEGEREKFLTAYVSEDSKIIGIEHDADADWHKVHDAHIALWNRLEERIRDREKCPRKPAIRATDDAGGA